MTAEMIAIKTAYEDEGMEPKEISEDRRLDLAAVKAALMQSSSKYRKDCGKEDEEEDDLNFSNDELRRVNQEIYQLALSAEDPHLRFKASTYIRDDKKGRKEVVKNMGGQQFNVLMINERMQQVRQVADKIKQKISTQKAINV